MNEKQHDLFQQSIQWAVDYHRDVEAGRWPDSQRHEQALWIHGTVQTDKVVSVAGFDYHPVCGTSCCLAGKAVILHGDTPLADAGDLSGSANLCLTDEGQIESVSERAQYLFGITTVEAAFMFSGGNSPDALVRRGTDVANTYGHTLTVI